jgi:hypothetical protein
MSPLRDRNVTQEIANESIPPRLFSEKSCMPLTDTLSARTIHRHPRFRRCLFSAPFGWRAIPTGRLPTRFASDCACSFACHCPAPAVQHRTRTDRLIICGGFGAQAIALNGSVLPFGSAPHVALLPAL